VTKKEKAILCAALAMSEPIADPTMQAHNAWSNTVRTLVVKKILSNNDIEKTKFDFYRTHRFPEGF